MSCNLNTNSLIAEAREAIKNCGRFVCIEDGWTVFENIKTKRQGTSLFVWFNNKVIEL